MKIVIQSINFHPELTGIGKYTGEMAYWLALKGHDVHVITAPPYYPGWKISAGFRKYFWSKEIWSGVEVWRCPIWVPKSPSGIKRILHLMSFAVSSLPIMLRQIFWRPDVILTIEPPIFSAPFAIVAAYISCAKSILHIQDYEIDAAFDLGLLKGAWLKKIVLKVERNLLQRFDLVCTISRRMMDRALNKGINSDKILLFPNWVDISPELKFTNQKPAYLDNLKFSYRERLNLPQDSIVALYSGNMGVKQGLEILGQVAQLCENSYDLLSPIHFVFCGDGVGRVKLEEQCAGLSFVHFFDLQPAEYLANFLAMADIHLLPQLANAADLVMPSKLTGIMASGRPVIVGAHIGTELAEVVRCCGLVIPPEDPVSFYKALIILASDRNLRSTLGLAGLEYAINNLERDSVLYGFEKNLKKMIE